MQSLSIALFAGILLLNSCTNKPSEQANSNNLSTTHQLRPETSTPETAVAPADVTITKADTGKSKSLIFLIKNVTEPTIDRQLVTAPEEGEKYIAVQVWMRNTSDSDVDIEREAFKLSDQNDAEFVEKTGFVEHRKRPFIFSAANELLTLKPGKATSGWITFTTDKESKARKITFENVTVNL